MVVYQLEQLGQIFNFFSYLVHRRRIPYLHCIRSVPTLSPNPIMAQNSVSSHSFLLSSTILPRPTLDECSCVVAVISTCTGLQTSSSTASLCSQSIFPSFVFPILTAEVSISFHFWIFLYIFVFFFLLILSPSRIQYRNTWYMGFNVVVGSLDCLFEWTRVCRILNLGFSELRMTMVPEHLPSLAVRMNLFSLLLFLVLWNGMS